MIRPRQAAESSWARYAARKSLDTALRGRAEAVGDYPAVALTVLDGELRLPARSYDLTKYP
jgi:hypothetical protein